MFSRDYCINSLLRMKRSTESEFQISKVTLDDLPEESLLKILSYMSLSEVTEVVQNVCKHWRRLSHNPVLWRDKKFCVEHTADGDIINFLQQWPQVCNVIMKRTVSASVFKALCDNCSCLNVLKIETSQKMPHYLLKKLVFKCSNIRSLSIPCRFLDDSVKSHTISRLHKLQYLEITQNLRKNKTIYMAPLAVGCPNLSRLEFSEKINVSVVDFPQFINVNCQTLTHAKLPWIIYGNRCVVPLMKECTSLISLELSNCNISETEDEASDIFKALGHMFNLQSLTFHYFKGCPPGVAARTFKYGRLANLQLLDIHNSYLENKAVVAICMGCPKLKTLRLTLSKLLTDKGLRKLYLLTELEMLDLSFCKCLGGAAIKYVAQLPKLRKLLLNWIDIKKLQPGLEHIEFMSSLEILSLSHTKNTSSFPFNRIPVKLRVLNVKTYLDGRNILKMLKVQMPALKVIEPNYDHPDNLLLSDIDIARLMEL